MLNLEGWLIDATGYVPGLPSPMRPISVLAQNLGGIPSVLIQRCYKARSRRHETSNVYAAYEKSIPVVYT